MSNLMVISCDTHAGAEWPTYRDYLPQRLRAPFDDWLASYEVEMAERKGTFFDQDAQENLANNEAVAEGGIAGEWDSQVRTQQIEADGIVAEVIFPQMAPFGGGLLQYRNAVDPEQNLEGNRAYNRWLADLCKELPGRRAGVALISVEDLDLAVAEVKAAKEMGLWGGVLIPAGTGDNEYYHHPRYEPLWSACEDLEMPVHTHSGWSPDYGDVPAATAMFIAEVAWYAHRPFTCFVWSGVFERHPKLKLIMTEQGCSWILDTLRQFERHFDQPYFKYFHKDLSLRPSEYFQRQCYIGASMLNPDECGDRHRIGVDRIMWGSDYPHLEGTWPNTMESLRATFGSVSEKDTRMILGENAISAFGFDRGALEKEAARVGPKPEALHSPG